MEDGLQGKAIRQQEVRFLLSLNVPCWPLPWLDCRSHTDALCFRLLQQVAERSRLAREGLFEPHMSHEAMTNLTEEHRDVASGSKVFGGPDVQSQIAETLKDGGIGKQVLENQKLN